MPTKAVGRWSENPRVWKREEAKASGDEDDGVMVWNQARVPSESCGYGMGKKRRPCSRGPAACSCLVEQQFEVERAAVPELLKEIHVGLLCKLFRKLLLVVCWEK